MTDGQTERHDCVGNSAVYQLALLITVHNSLESEKIGTLNYINDFDKLLLL